VPEEKTELWLGIPSPRHVPAIMVHIVVFSTYNWFLFSLRFWWDCFFSWS